MLSGLGKIPTSDVSYSLLPNQSFPTVSQRISSKGSGVEASLITQVELVRACYFSSKLTNTGGNILVTELGT